MTIQSINGRKSKNNHMKRTLIITLLSLHFFVSFGQKEIMPDYVNYKATKVHIQELNNDFNPINSVESNVLFITQLHPSKNMIFINYSGNIYRFGIDEMKYEQSGMISYFASSIDSNEDILVIIDEKKKVVLVQLHESKIRILYEF